jgi:hypothetical protein
MFDEGSMRRRLQESRLLREWPTPRHYHGLSVARSVQSQAYVAAVWAYKTAMGGQRARQRLHATKRLKGSGRGRRSLLIATGPSAAQLDVPRAVALQSSGSTVFAVNSYNDIDYSDTLIPDYYVLTDPAWHAGWEEVPEFTRTWEYITAHPAIRVVVPANTELSGMPSGPRFEFINTIGLEGWTRSTSPVRPRGYLGLTAFSALSLIQYMEFDTTYLIGVDNTVFRALDVTGDGSVVVGPSHAYAESEPVSLAPITTMEAALEFYARHFHDLRFFDTDRLVNLNPNSVIPFIRIGVLPELTP